MSMGLTAPQSRLLTFIKDWIAKEGYPLTYRQMCDGLGYKSLSVPHHLVKQLIKRGCVRAQKYMRGTLEIIDEAPHEKPAPRLVINLKGNEFINVEQIGDCDVRIVRT